MKICRLAMVSASAGAGPGAAGAGGEVTEEVAVGPARGVDSEGLSACTRAAIPVRTVPKSMAGGVGATGAGANSSLNAPKVCTKSWS